jgi:hypothetical protein
MINFLVEKHIAESFAVGFDFTDLLAAGDTISSCAVSAIDQKYGVDYSTGANKVINSTTATLDGTSKIASARLIDGAAGYKYIVTFTATTLGGDVLIGKLLLMVKA